MINLQTKKSELKENYDIQGLYEQASIEEMEDALKEHQINIKQEDVLKKYEKCYSIYELDSQYRHQYVEQLEELSEQDTVLDEECIFHYILKIVEDNYQSDDLKDPYYIEMFMEDYTDLDEDTYAKNYLKILRAMNHLQDHTDERNLQKIFQYSYLDIEDSLCSDAIENISSVERDLTMTKSITDELFLLVKNYQLEHPANIYSCALQLLAQHGYKEVKDKIEEGIQLFPAQRYMIYNNVLASLTEHSEDNDHVIELYKEAISTKPTTEVEQHDFECLTNDFHYLLS